MASAVLDVPPAEPDEVRRHFERRLAFETDCADVHAAMAGSRPDFVLLDVRGPDAYRRGHVPGALNLPNREIAAARLATWPADTVFVVYCAGPHCNGADRAALRLAGLDRRVKIMLGGITGWHDEGFALVTGTDHDAPTPP